MTREAIAAQSGWGKSWVTQKRVCDHLDRFDYVIVADYKDEYRGLAKADLCDWLALGSAERGIGFDGWRELIQANPYLVVARSVGLADWRRWVATVSKIAQSLDGNALVVIDEAHFVAPQSTGYPDAITELATTGRGNGVASMWVTQRLQKIDETPVSQADSRLFGGFTSDRDLDKIGKTVSYPQEVHNPQIEHPSGPWDDSLGRYSDGDGLTGSEWIWSTTDGDRDRVDTRDWKMSAPHYGGEAPSLDSPA